MTGEMKRFLDKIPRRLSLIRDRISHELLQKELSAGDIEKRVRADVVGSAASDRYLSRLYSAWLDSERPEPRHYDSALIAPQTDAILERRVRILGRDIDLTDTIEWHRDPFFGVLWPKKYIGALSDRRGGSDIVLLWQLNKMMFLLDVSYAFRTTGDDRFARFWVETVCSWVASNPYRVGINWRSCLEMATRVIVWCIGLREIGTSKYLTEEKLESIIGSLVQQVEFIASHFSRRETPNNHLIGEAASVFLFAAMWPEFEASAAWRADSESILVTEIERQVLSDGVTYEGAFNYHAFVLDFYLVYMLAKYLEGETPDKSVLGGVRRMIKVVTTSLSPTGRLPHFGDEHVDQFFILRSLSALESRQYAERITTADCMKPEFAGVMQTTEWGKQLFDIETPIEISAHFSQSGVSVIRHSSNHLVHVAGPVHNAKIPAGHHHSDAASFELEVGGEPVFVDSGTYLYLYDADTRSHFRGARAHNTVLVDGIDPLVDTGFFKWREVPRSRVEWFASRDGCAGVVSVRRLPADHATFDHRRVILELRNSVWLIVDHLQPQHKSDASGKHTASVLFHMPLAPDNVRGGQEERTVRLQMRTGVYYLSAFASAPYKSDLITNGEEKMTWHSPRYGTLEKGTTLEATVEFEGTIAVVHALSMQSGGVRCESLQPDHAALRVEYAGGGSDGLRMTFDPVEIILNDQKITGDVAA